MTHQEQDSMISAVPAEYLKQTPEHSLSGETLVGLDE